jgi:electron transport complex protein RnfD
MILQVSSSPHIRGRDDTRRLMLDVIIALLPAVAASVYFFGLRALLVILISVVSAVGFEYLSRKVMKRYNSIGDLSAVVTGLLISFNLPPTVPFWLPVIGSLVAIVAVKQMFGGIGQNFVNPALASRVILSLSFPALMTTWSIQASRALESGLIRQVGESVRGTDLIATATPLYLLQNAGGVVLEGMPGYLQLFFGFKGGCLGEVSIFALLIGALYLTIRKVITLDIPLAYLATVALMTFLAGQDPLYHILSGGLFLGAVFMATDYVTSPLTRRGKIVFGIGCGLLTGLIRLFGGMTEGVSFSILLMNILTPHLDRWTIPVQFGGGRRNVKG